MVVEETKSALEACRGCPFLALERPCQRFPAYKSSVAMTGRAREGHRIAQHSGSLAQEPLSFLLSPRVACRQPSTYPFLPQSLLRGTMIVHEINHGISVFVEDDDFSLHLSL
eukprot:752751-Hanusia_phi.AAC.3